MCAIVFVRPSDTTERLQDALLLTEVNKPPGGANFQRFYS